jgi:hypothetical protein
VRGESLCSVWPKNKIEWEYDLVERPPARARALRALLSNPNLRVFSRLVLDQATATEMLK